MFRKKPQYVANRYVPAPPPPQASAPTIDNTIHNASMRNGSLDARIVALEAEVANHKKDMQRSRPGTATYNSSKRRALQAIRQKKSLEQRIQSSGNAQFNLEQVRDAQFTQQDNIAMVQGMKVANQELKQAQAHIDLDEVEDLRDDMEETLGDLNEVGDVLGRQYDVDNIDQTELEAELDELEEDSIGYASASANVSTPSYLQPQYPTAPAQQQQHAAPQNQPPGAYSANPQGNRY